MKQRAMPFTNIGLYLLPSFLLSEDTMLELYTYDIWDTPTSTRLRLERFVDLWDKVRYYITL